MTQPYAAPLPGQVRTSGRAIAALVTGIVSMFFCGLLAGIPAIVLGVLALREIRTSGGRVGGGGLAIAGIVTGIVGTLLSLFVILVFVWGGAIAQHFETCTGPPDHQQCTKN